MMSAYDAAQAGFKKGDWVLASTKEGEGWLAGSTPFPI